MVLTYFSASTIFSFFITVQLIFKLLFFPRSIFFTQNTTLYLLYIFLCVIAVATGEVLSHRNLNFNVARNSCILLGIHNASHRYLLLQYTRGLARLLLYLSLFIFLLQLYILISRYALVGSVVDPGQLRAYLNINEDYKLPSYFYLLRIAGSSCLSLLVLSFSLRRIISFFCSYPLRLLASSLTLCNVAVLLCIATSFLSFFEGSRNSLTIFAVFFLVLISQSLIPNLRVSLRRFLKLSRISSRLLKNSFILISSALLLLYLFDMVASQRSSTFYGSSDYLVEKSLNNLYYISGMSVEFDKPSDFLALFYFTHSLDRIADLLSNSTFYLFRFEPGSNLLLIPFRIFCSLGFSGFCEPILSFAPGYVEGLFHGAIGDLVLDFGPLITLFCFFILGYCHSRSISSVIASSSFNTQGMFFSFLSGNVAYISLSSLFVLSPLYLLYGGSTFLMLPQVIFFVFVFPLIAVQVTNRIFPSS